MNQKEQANDELAKIQKAFESPEIEKLYFNGFSCGIAPGDVCITLFLNGQAVTVLNTSYTVAKTLAEKLTELVHGLESVTGQEIMTSEYIKHKMLEQQKQSEIKT